MNSDVATPLAVVVQESNGVYTHRFVQRTAPHVGPAPLVPGGAPTMQATGAIGQVLEIAIDTDFELFSVLGNDVDATVAFVERVIHDVDVIFERDTGVSIELTAVVVRPTAADPYTSSDAGVSLNQMRNEWASGSLASVQRDVAHLMSGRHFDGALILQAFFDSICDPSQSYAVTEILFGTDDETRAWMHAYALGRAFGVSGCSGADCRIMCSAPFGCASDITSFGAASAAIIRATAASAPCLRDLHAPARLPFTENFVTAQVDEVNWVSNPVSGISDLSSQPPSPPFAARLTERAPGVGDRWISNKIELSDAVLDPTMTYAAQHHDVAAGGELRVEFIDAGGVWTTLDSVVSDGTNPAIFDLRSLALPPAALHDAFQLRFTAHVDGPGEEWFIDDIEIGASAQNYCVAAPNSVSTEGATLTVGANSSVSIAANDFELIASSCPSQSFGIYIYGSERHEIALGNGFLCVGGPQIFRAAVVQANAAGVSSFALDQMSLPSMSVISPGDTVRFQLWYRDSVGAGFNLTNGLEATFVP